MREIGATKDIDKSTERTFNNCALLVCVLYTCFKIAFSYGKIPIMQIQGGKANYVCVFLRISTYCIQACTLFLPTMPHASRPIVPSPQHRFDRTTTLFTRRSSSSWKRGSHCTPLVRRKGTARKTHVNRKTDHACVACMNLARVRLRREIT